MAMVESSLIAMESSWARKSLGLSVNRSLKTLSSRKEEVASVGSEGFSATENELSIFLSRGSVSPPLTVNRSSSLLRKKFESV